MNQKCLSSSTIHGVLVVFLYSLLVGACAKSELRRDRGFDPRRMNNAPQSLNAIDSFGLVPLNSAPGCQSMGRIEPTISRVDSSHSLGDVHDGGGRASLVDELPLVFSIETGGFVVFYKSQNVLRLLQLNESGSQFLEKDRVELPLRESLSPRAEAAAASRSATLMSELGSREFFVLPAQSFQRRPVLEDPENKFAVFVIDDSENSEITLVKWSFDMLPVEEGAAHFRAENFSTFARLKTDQQALLHVISSSDFGLLTAELKPDAISNRAGLKQQFVEFAEYFPSPEESAPFNLATGAEISYMKQSIGSIPANGTIRILGKLAGGVVFVQGNLLSVAQVYFLKGGEQKPNLLFEGPLLDASLKGELLYISSLKNAALALNPAFGELAVGGLWGMDLGPLLKGADLSAPMSLLKWQRLSRLEFKKIIISNQSSSELSELTSLEPLVFYPQALSARPASESSLSAGDEMDLNSSDSDFDFSFANRIFGFGPRLKLDLRNAEKEELVEISDLGNENELGTACRSSVLNRLYYVEDIGVLGLSDEGELLRVFQAGQ